MPRLLILGGGGFIGSHVAQAAVRSGLPVRVLDRQIHPFATIPPAAEVVLADWTDRAALSRALAGCDAVVHLISCSVPGDGLAPSHEIASNVLPTLALLDLLVEAGIGNLVFASSGGTVYGNPGSGPFAETDELAPRCSYGLGKVLIEQCLRYHAGKTGAAVTVLRPSNPYGPGQSPLGRQGVIPIFMRRIAIGEPIVLYGDPARDFLYVEDLADAFVRALDSPRGFRVLNVGSGQATRLRDLIGLVEATVGRQASVRHEPYRPCDVPTNTLSPHRIRAELGWSARTDLTTGVARTWEWIRQIV